MSITAPTDIGGCILWLDGSLGVTLTSSKVSTWADQSGTGNHWNQTVAANRPTVATADLNGRDTLAFAAGTNQYLNGPSLFTGLSSAEILVVVKAANDPPTTGSGGFWHFGTSGSASHLPFTDGNIYDDFGSTVRKTVGNPALSLAGTYRLYAVRTAAGAWAARLNGQIIFRTSTNTVGWAAAPTLGFSLTSYFNGNIAAVYAYNAPLAYTDYVDLTNYINARFGILDSTATTPVGTAPSHGSELIGWYKGDAGLTYGTMGELGTWADQSGNGNDATQATTAAKPYAYGSLNGRPAVRFVGSASSILGLPDMFGSLTSGEMMVVAVADADPPATRGALIRNDTTSAPYWPYIDNNIYESWGSGARYNFAHTGQSLATPRFYNVWSAPNDYAVMLDETTLFTHGAGHVWGHGTAPSIGGNALDAWLTGRIAEVLLFNRKLTASERGRWRDYLSDRWGLGLTWSGYTLLNSARFRVMGSIG